MAKRRLGTGRIKVSALPYSLEGKKTNLNNPYQVWGCDIIVDWADPQEEPDEQTMSKVKVLYVRNLTQDVSEDKLKVRSHQILAYSFIISYFFNRSILSNMAK